MYNIKMDSKTLIYGEELLEGETIEQKVERMMSNKEPIKDGAPLLYTERKDGVLPGYNIRTDRFELAADAMDKITASKLAKRNDLLKKEEDEKEAKIVNMDGKPESTDGKQEILSR